MTRTHGDLARVMLRRRVTRVVRHLPAAIRGEVEAVHDARVATRRLREAVPVLAEGKRARALAREARRLGRALGPVREADVLIETLAEIAERAGLRDRSIGIVRRAFEDDRRRVDAEMRGRVTRSAVAARAGRLFDELGASRAGRGVSSAILKAEARRYRRARRLREAVEHAAGLYLPDRLHAVRIAVKKLRYSTELVQELRGLRRSGGRGPVRTSGVEHARLRTLRGAQETLGRLHDLEVLAMRVRALQGTAAVTGLQTSEELDRLVRQLETECRTLHAEYVASRPALLENCARAEAAGQRRDAARRSA